MLLYDTEGNCGLRGSAGLGDGDAGNVGALRKVHHLCQIILAEVVAGEDDTGFVFGQDELVVQCLEGATGTEVGAAYADYHHEVYAAPVPVVTHGLALGDELLGSAVGKVFPAKEVVAGPVAGGEDVIGLQGLLLVVFQICVLNEGIATAEIYFYHILEQLFLKRHPGAGGGEALPAEGV